MIFDSFSKVSALVVGDVMLDRYLYGSVNRISPEAPVPIANIINTEDKAGGAANVAQNICQLGADVFLIGIVGSDEFGESLKKVLNDAHINSELFVTEKTTTAKYRVIGNHQQIVRLDFENPEIITEEIEDQIFEKVSECIDDYHIVVISDYNKGICTEKLCSRIIGLCNEKNKQVLVDPKGFNWKKYNYATLITPNLKELSDIIGFQVNNLDEEIESVGKKLLATYNLDHLIITRSQNGISLVSSESVTHYPTPKQEVYDVSGAGDTVVAVIAIMIAAGFPIDDAVKTANIAAASVIGKLGTVPVTLDALLVKNPNAKLLSIDEFIFLAESFRKQGKKIVFTNGCFDLLHEGHMKFLKEASGYGDKLVVGLNSDRSIANIKGKDRPINNQQTRIEILSSLSYVDYIILFDEDTPYYLIKAIRPDVLIKGGDYSPDDIIGKEFAAETVTGCYLQGVSTSSIIEKIRKV